jgi:predicted dehydrogenase
MTPSLPKIRVGLVGAGQWAAFGHIPALRSLPRYELHAVATTRKSTAQEAAAKFGFPHAHVGYDSLIADPDVDLVVVNNRAPEHFPVALAAIEAGKHVYCEWPLTTNTADSKALLNATVKADVRHAVGLQRRMSSSSFHLQRLLSEGYVGDVRSVRLHVTEPTFYKSRLKVLWFTVPGENFSSVASIYAGHYLDMVLNCVGWPRDLSALLVNQFESVELEESGEVLSSTAPDQMLISGTLEGGSTVSVHVEGGKRNGYGVRLDITGTEGDLRLTYSDAFSNWNDGVLEGARGSRQPLVELPTPEDLRWLPTSGLKGSVLELANLFAAFEKDIAEGTSHAPNFADGVRLHRLLDAVTESSESGRRTPFEPKN